MERKRELTALNHRRVEDLLHEPGDLLRAKLDDGRELALLVGCGGHREKTRGAENGVQLISELVPEIRQELGVADLGLWRASRLCRGRGLGHLHVVLAHPIDL